LVVLGRQKKIRQLEGLKASIISTRVMLQSMDKMPAEMRRRVDGGLVADAATKALKAGHAEAARAMLTTAIADVPAGVDATQWSGILQPALRVLG
jgi:hypothetical protein